MLAGTCVHAHTWAYAHGCHCVPECLNGVYVGGQVVSGHCYSFLSPGCHRRVSALGFPFIDRCTNRAVCLLTCYSCCVACVQSPEPVSPIPPSPALASSVIPPLPCAARTYQNVWVCTSTHASHVRTLCLCDVPTSPFQTSFPIVKAPLSQHPFSLCFPFAHT